MDQSHSTSPYAHLHAGSPIELPKRNVFLMVVLVLITYFVYLPIWYLRRVDVLNKLDSKVKLSKAPVFLILAASIGSLLILILEIVYVDPQLINLFDGIDRVLSWIIGIGNLILAYKVRSILTDHFKKDVSSAGTFFFSIFYLQYKMNRLKK